MPAASCWMETHTGLVEAHTHNPSEHTIDGERIALEMHLVHKRESGEIAVVGILYRLGEPDPAIQAIIDAAPKQGETIKPTSPMKASDFLPATHGYYAYTGSLTTPPYTEGVKLASNVRDRGGLSGAGHTTSGPNRRRNQQPPHPAPKRPPDNRPRRTLTKAPLLAFRNRCRRQRHLRS